MTSIAVKDLKRPCELCDLLDRDRELVVTKDGQPFAIMVGIDSDAAEDTLREIRRALFSSSILRARRKARNKPVTDSEIAAEITAARGALSG